MASIYDLKPKFQNMLRPFVNGLARKGITANMVTLFAVVCSILMGFGLYFWRGNSEVLCVVPFVLFIRMALNAIDGMLAREHHMKSDLGAILNELGDVISDVALYIPLALIAPFNPILIVSIVILSIVTEVIGLLGYQIGGKRRYDGPCGKSDRAFIFGTLCFFLGVHVSLDTYMIYIQLSIVVLLVLTIFNRARKALEESS